MSRLEVPKKIEDLKRSKIADLFQSQSRGTDITPWAYDLKCKCGKLPLYWLLSLLFGVPQLLKYQLLYKRDSSHIPFLLLNWYLSGRKKHSHGEANN